MGYVYRSTDRAYWEDLSQDDKRKQYTCRGGYVTLEDIKPWQQQLDIQGTVRPRFKATLLNNYEARGRIFWRLKNYIEVLVSHI